jgi:predicted kinase
VREPLVIAVPDPSLVVLVGAAGAGKSTFAARHFSPGEVVSSDAYRAWIAGDPADQTATRAAFAALHREVVRRLGRGELTVVDATNVLAHARRSLLRRAGLAGVPAIAIVLDLPRALVLARNATRAGAVVPEAAVRRQLDDLERAVRADRFTAEGFAAVTRLVDARDVDAILVRRERR